MSGAAARTGSLWKNEIKNYKKRGIMILEKIIQQDMQGRYNKNDI